MVGTKTYMHFPHPAHTAYFREGAARDEAPAVNNTPFSTADVGRHGYSPLSIRRHRSARNLLPVVLIDSAYGPRKRIPST